MRRSPFARVSAEDEQRDPHRPGGENRDREVVVDDVVADDRLESVGDRRAERAGDGHPGGNEREREQEADDEHPDEDAWTGDPPELAARKDPAHRVGEREHEKRRYRESGLEDEHRDRPAEDVHRIARDAVLFVLAG